MSKLTNKDTNPVYDDNGNLIEFTIKREKWGMDTMFTENEEGNEVGCCLAHYGLASAVPKPRMYGNSYLTDAFADNKIPERFRWLRKESTMRKSRKTLESILGWVNDETKGSYASKTAKEKRIKAIFGKQGIKVNFV